jgi:hypothetical protein
MEQINVYKWKREGERIESETKCVNNLEKGLRT